MPSFEVILYTRSNCCLCDEAEQLLNKHFVRHSKVDIDSEPDLQNKFDTCVPVVEIDGKVRFRGKMNEILLKRLLDARSQ